MPPSASSKRPSLRAGRAGERALLVAEQLGLEQRLRQRRAVDRDERARLRRGERSWMARATSSLPVPLSPWMSTVAELSATCSTSVIMRRKAGLAPIIVALPEQVVEPLLQRPVLLR